MRLFFERIEMGSASLLFLFLLAITAGHAPTVWGGQQASADDSKLSPKNSIYAKIVLPMKAPAEGEHPLVESWIAKKLRKRGETDHRAVTDWVRLAEQGEESTHVWNATVDGKGWGCPVGGRVVERAADGNVKVELSGWTPFGAEIKRDTLLAETGSRRIAVVDSGRVDRSAMAYVALLVGPPPKAPSLKTAGVAHVEVSESIFSHDFSLAGLKELRGKQKPILVFCRADWDVTCVLLDRTLFTDKRVIDAIKKLEYIPLLADCTNPSEDIKGFLREVALWHGQATIVVFRGKKNKDPVVLRVNRADKYISAEDLLDAMQP